MSRNLGAEISRRLFEAEDKEGAPKEDGVEREDADEDDFVETVVTTHRTRVSSFPCATLFMTDPRRKLEPRRPPTGPIMRLLQLELVVFGK